MGIHINGDNNVVHNNVTTYNSVADDDDELPPLPGITLFWLVAVIIVGLMVRYWQITLTALGLVVAGWMLWADRRDRERVKASAKNEAKLRATALAQRAEEQNSAYLRGEAQGLYGNFPPPKI